MANANVSFQGQIAGQGDKKALLLEVFSGMVLAKFDVTQVTRERTTQRTITSGKSAQFPMVWQGTASYHTAGTEIVGSVIQHAGKTITIEEQLIADAFVGKLEDAMNHYETKSEYAHQLGEALANAYDSNNFRSIYKGADFANNPHPIDSSGDGVPLRVAAMSTTASVLKTAVWDGAQTLDEKNVPKSDRTCGVLPLAFYLLLEDGEFVNRDFGNTGSMEEARLTTAAGLDVVMSNNIPTTDETPGVANVPDALEDNYLEYIGAIFHKSAAATVTLLGLNVEREYDVRRQGDLLVASYAIGQSFLRTEACVSLEDSNL
jgi:hypothetical protein